MGHPILLELYVRTRPDEGAKRKAAAEAAERTLNEEVRRAELWLDLTHPDTKAELEKDIARGDDIHPAHDGTAKLEGQPEKKSRLSRIWKRIKAGKRDTHTALKTKPTRESMARVRRSTLRTTRRKLNKILD